MHQRQLTGNTHGSSSQQSTARRKSFVANTTTTAADGLSAAALTQQHDESLIFASLDQQNPDDEAENTLLNILERRQVALTNNGDGLSILVNSRRHSRKVSMPEMPDTTTGRVAPSHLDRRRSLARTGSSMRDLLSTSSPTVERIASDSDSNNARVPPTNAISGKHQRAKSHFALPQGLSTSGERAHFVAQQMKTDLLENTDAEEPGVLAENNLGDYLHMLEARRDLDDARSQNASGGSRGGPESIGESKSRSRGNRSRGPVVNRPFSEITSPFSADKSSDIEHMFAAVDCLHELMQIPEGDNEDEKVEEDDSFIQQDQLADQNTNFLAQLVASHPEIEDADEEAANLNEHTPLKSPQRGTPRTRARFWINSDPCKGSWLYKLRAFLTFLRRQMGILAIAFDVQYVKSRLWAFFQNELTLVIVPALATAAAFYYRLGNPTLFQTGATVSWFILFLLRNFIALEAAYVTQYLFVDVFVMQSPLSIQLIGPLTCLYTINSKGWPFLVTSWALWCLLLIKGRSCWFGFGAIDLYLFTDRNESGGLADATLYTNILLSMVRMFP